MMKRKKRRNFLNNKTKIKPLHNLVSLVLYVENYMYTFIGRQQTKIRVQCKGKLLINDSCDVANDSLRKESNNSNHLNPKPTTFRAMATMNPPMLSEHIKLRKKRLPCYLT